MAQWAATRVATATGSIRPWPDPKTGPGSLTPTRDFACGMDEAPRYLALAQLDWIWVRQSVPVGGRTPPRATPRTPPRQGPRLPRRGMRQRRFASDPTSGLRRGTRNLAQPKRSGDHGERTPLSVRHHGARAAANPSAVMPMNIAPSRATAVKAPTGEVHRPPMATPAASVRQARAWARSVPSCAAIRLHPAVDGAADRPTTSQTILIFRDSPVTSFSATRQ